MKRNSYGQWSLFVLLAAFVIGGCADDREFDRLTESTLQAKKECPPGADKKGECEEPPPPPLLHHREARSSPISQVSGRTLCTRRCAWPERRKAGFWRRTRRPG